MISKDIAMDSVRTSKQRTPMFTRWLRCLLLLTAVLFGLDSAAVGQSIVLDLAAEPLNFLNSNRCILPNSPPCTPGAAIVAGQVHEYRNVITTSGPNPITVMARMEIVSRSPNLTISNTSDPNQFDDDNAGVGRAGRFQPRLGNSSSSAEAMVEYAVTFYDQNTGTQILPKNFFITAVDIDGGNSGGTGPREFVEIGGYTSYTVANNSGLTITHNYVTNRTRFRAIPGDLDGIDFDNTASVIVYIEQPVSTLNFAAGTMGNTGSRQFSLNIGANADTFTGGTTTEESPFVTAVDDIGFTVSNVTGGIAVFNVVANDFFDGELVTIDDVDLTLVSDPGNSPSLSLNTSTGQLTVAPGAPLGSHKLIYQICLKTDANNCDTATAWGFVVAPQVTATKSAPANIVAGQTIPYTVTIHNASNDVATVNPFFSDPLPAGTQYVANSTVVTLNGNPVVVDGSTYPFGTESPLELPNIPTNGTIVITYSVLVPLDYSSDEVANQGTVGYDGPGLSVITLPTDDPNTPTAGDPTITSVTFPPVADDDEKLTQPLGPVTLNVTDNDSDADGDLDPSTVQFAGTSGPGAPLVVPNVGTWSVDEDGEVTFTPHANFDYSQPVSVNYTVRDGAGNTSNMANITVGYAVADVNVGKVADKPYAPVGEKVTFTITVSNSGPHDATGVVVTDTLSAGFRVDELSISHGGVFDEASNTIVWSISSLPSGPGGVALTFEATVNEATGQSAEYLNRVWVTDSDQFDPTLLNNYDEQGVGVPAIGILKSADYLDGVITYTYTVKNLGNVTLDNVTIVETGFTGDENELEGPTPALDAGNPWDQVLDPGDEWIFTATYEVQPDDFSAGSITNQATAYGLRPGGDPGDEPGDGDDWVSDLSDDDSGGEGEFGPNDPGQQITDRDDPTEIDLTPYQTRSAVVTKAASASVVVGDTFTYTIAIENTGNATISGATLADLLPSGVEYVANSAVVGGVNLNASSYPFGTSYTLPTIASGTTLTVTFDITVPLEYAGTTVSNQASVDIGEPEPVLSDDPNTQDESDPTVTAVQHPPVAVDDTMTDQAPGAVTVDVTDNDTDANGDLDPSTVQFLDENDQPVVGDLVVTGEGTWSVDGNGNVTFTPQAGYYGNPAPVKYIVEDEEGNVSNSATITIEYLLNPSIAIVKTALVEAEYGIIRYTYTVTNTGNVPLDDIEVYDNDPLVVTAGGTAFTGLGTLNPIVFNGGDDNNNGLLDLDEEWIFRANYAIAWEDMDNGSVTNQALAVGTPPIGDEVDDLSGTEVGNDDPTVTDLTPYQITGASVTKSADASVAVGGTITYAIEIVNTGTVTISDATLTDVLPSGVTYVANSAVVDGNNLNAGTYPFSSAYVLPALGAQDTLAVTFQVTVPEDYQGLTVSNQASVDIGEDDPVLSDDPNTPDEEDDPTQTAVHFPPVAVDDTSEGNVAGPVTVDDVTGNDTDKNGDGDIDPATVVFVDAGGNVIGTDSGKTLEVPGEGTWTVDGNGDVTFTPLPTFTQDPTPVYYTVQDSQGLTSNVATITVDYVPVAAADTSADNTIGSPVVIEITSNDTDGDTVDPSTVDLVLPGGATDPVTDGGRTIGFTVPGEGTWSYDPSTGELTFTPETGFYGNPTAIGYTVEDHEGNVSQEASVTVTYEQKPAIGITKAASYESGVITYTYTVKNLGDVPLGNISVIEDENLFTGNGTLPSPSYASGDLNEDDWLDTDEEWVFTASYTVVLADRNAGSISNQASVRGLRPGGDPDPSSGDWAEDLSDDDSEGEGEFGPNDPGQQITDRDDPTETDLPQNPAIGLVKTGVFNDDGEDDFAGDGVAQAGETVSYTFTVTNTGDVSLTQITLSDEQFTGTGTLGLPLAPVSGDTNGDSVMDPGEVWVFTTDYTLTQADVDAGFLSNRAKVEALDPGEEPVEDESGTGNDAPGPGDPGYDPDCEECTVTPLPKNAELTLIKSGEFADAGSGNDAFDGNGTAEADELINYTFTVVNTGNVTVNEIALADALPGLAGFTFVAAQSTNLTEGVLAPGDTAVYTATYALTQADINAGFVRNTATVTGEDPQGGEVSDESESDNEYQPEEGEPGYDPDCEECTVTPLPQKPAIGILKAAVFNDDGEDDFAGDGFAQAGETVSYTYTVRNTGNVTLTNVAVQEAVGSFSGTGTLPVPTAALDGTDPWSGVLTPGQEWTFTATYVLTQADVDAGGVSNQATAHGLKFGGEFGDGPGDGDDWVSDDSDSDSEQSPGKYGPDDENDDAEDWDDPTQTDLPQNPAIQIVKAGVFNDDGGSQGGVAGDEIVQAGETVTYTFTVTNTGNVTLTDVELSDEQFTGTGTLTLPSAPVSGDTNGDSVMEPGEVWTFEATYTLTQADVDAGFLSNRAKVEALDPSDDPVEDESGTGNDVPGPGDPGYDPDCEECTVIPLPKTAALTLVKAGVFNDDGGSQGGVAGDEIAQAGETVAYTFTVTNTGNVTLTDVELSDEQFTGVGNALDIVFGTWPAAPGVLAPGDSVLATATYTLLLDDVNAGFLSNRAKAEGLDPNEDPVEAESGTGNDIPGPDDPGYNPDCPECTVTPLPQRAELTLVKSSALPVDTNGNGVTDAGDHITYTFTVRNTGNVTVTSVAVADTLTGMGAISFEPTESSNPSEGALAPGDSAVYRATYGITQADMDRGFVRNTATATGEDPQGGDVTDESESGNEYQPGPDDPGYDPDCPECTVTPLQQSPAIGLLKAAVFNDDGAGDFAGDGFAQAGETISYTFTVKNMGNVTLSNVSIEEKQFSGTNGAPTVTFGDWPGDAFTLAPGDSVLATATYALTQADVDAGGVSNQATAHGLVPGGDPQSEPTGEPGDENWVSDDSDADSEQSPGKYGPDDEDDDAEDWDDPTETELPKNAAVSVVKTAQQAVFSVVGQVLTYEISVANAGNVTLSDVQVADATADAGSVAYVSGDDGNGRLDVGETWLYSASHTVTPDDIQNAGYTNVAKVSALDPQEETVNGQGEETVEYAANAIAAFDDDYTGAAANSVTGLDNLGNVLGNDTLNGAGADIGSVKIRIVTPAANHGVKLDIFTGVVSVEPGTPEGDYTVEYEICELANPVNCDTATVFVEVTCEGDTQISGRVVTDDPARTPLANVPVTLIPQGGTPGPVLMQVTDAEGRYAFPNLVPGDYLVQVQDANLNLSMNLYPVESSLFFTTLTACHPQFHNFVYGESGLVALGDLVWLDVNGNGVQDEWYDANNDGEVTKNVPDAAGFVDFSQWEWIDLNGDGRWDGPENEGELNKGGFGSDAMENVRVTGPNGFDDSVVVGLFGYWRMRAEAYGEYTAVLTVDEALNQAAQALAATGLVKPLPPQSATPQKATADGVGILALPGGEMVCEPTTGLAKSATLSAEQPVDFTLDFGLACYVKQALIANDDAAGPVSSELGGQGVVNAFDNDTYNGAPVVPSEVTLKVGGTEVTDPVAFEDAEGNPAPTVVLNPGGSVDVAPGTPAGTYEITYEICEVANPTNCDDAVITVTVSDVSAELSGTKFHDLNGNGARDEGEPGLAGWTIFVDMNGNGIFDEGEPSAVSDENGAWTIKDVPAGSFAVREVLPEGTEWLQSFPGEAGEFKHMVTISAQGELPHLLFGNHTPEEAGLFGGIFGVKWHDIDGDGAQDGDEPAMAAWTVYLDVNGNGRFDEGEPRQDTDEQGRYEFADLTPGTYQVREVMKGGWLQTHPGRGVELAHTVQVTEGFLTDVSHDFGNAMPVTISGYIWRDRNVNGNWETVEPLLNEWLVFLDANGNGVHDEGELFTYSDEDGNYLFDGLIPGSYKVVAVNRTDWIQIYPADGGHHEFTLRSGESAQGNFGIAHKDDLAQVGQPTFTTVEGNIWYDYAEDSAWDHKLGLDVPPNHILEVPVEGWTVTLKGTSHAGAVVDMATTTAADGSYAFHDVPAGEYRVNREYKDMWVPAFPLLVLDDPEGQSHIIRVEGGYGGVASRNRTMYKGNFRGWLSQLPAGEDALYAGVYLNFDTNEDGNADTHFFVSGPMSMKWTSGSSLKSDFEITMIDFVGESEEHGRIEMRRHPNDQRRILGSMRAQAGDSLAASFFDMPFDLIVNGNPWKMPEATEPEMAGWVSQMLPYNQKHVMTNGGLPFFDLAGRRMGTLLSLEVLPLYGADFATNQSVFGSAPMAQYPVRLEADGARHVQHHLNEERRLALGSGIDPNQLLVRNRASGQSGPKDQATDDNGVLFVTTIASGQEASVQVIATGEGYLHGWIDYNRDGEWTADERAINGVLIGSTMTVIDFQVPLGASAGESYARFRLCECPQLDSAVGPVSGGEVEDYLVTITSAGSTAEGVVWNDVNGNGLRDQGETGIAGIRVFGDLNGNGRLDEGEPVATSNNTGAFSLGNLPAGRVQVQPDYADRWVLTNIAGPSYTVVTLVDGDKATGLSFGLKSMATGLDETVEIPAEFGLEQNYPNPFNPATTIRYQLAEASQVSLAVFDMNGRVVATLVDKHQNAGSYAVTFDAAKLASGVYLYRLQAGGKTFTHKFTLLK